MPEGRMFMRSLSRRHNFKALLDLRMREPEREALTDVVGLPLIAKVGRQRLARLADGDIVQTGIPVQ